MKSLVIAETPAAARELCAGARTMADAVDVACVGCEPCTGAADTAYRIAPPEGAVLDDAYETVAKLCAEGSYDLVLVEPTRRLKLIAGRVAARNATSVLSDVISFDGETATSLYYGGLAHKRQHAAAKPVVCTVSSGLFAEAEPQGSDVVEDVAWIAPAKPVVRRAMSDLPKPEADLAAADVVVAAGRGFAEKDDLDMARELARKIGGELGCTRPLTEGVDWLPRERYIGVSGLMIAPRVYVGVGLSGQMQHMVGVNRAKTVVAVNKDKNAPIFKQADLGLVGDLYQVLPQLADKL